MGTDRLSKAKDCGFTVSYGLTPKGLTFYLLGAIPVRCIRLTDVEYLRLASPSEVSRWYYLRNWRHFQPSRAARCPVYVLQTKAKRRPIFLKLRGGAHFRLRTAIGRYRQKT